MDLELEFSYRAEVKMPVTVGAGPYGTRLFFEVVGGSFEGKRLKGKMLSGGGDWLLAGADGFARLDVRAQFLTDDGVAIYSSYGGLLENDRESPGRAHRSERQYGLRGSILPDDAAVRDRRPPPPSGASRRSGWHAG